MNHNYKLLAISFLILLVPIISKSQENYDINFDNLKQLALKENNQIENARTDILISKKKVWETTAIGLPQASASLSYNNFVDIPTTLVPAIMFNPNAPEGEFIALQFGTEHNASFEFNASQLIFSGEYIVGLQAAKTYKFLSEQNLKKTQNDVLESVYQTYYTLLFAKKNLEVFEATKADMQKSINESTEIYNQGLMDKTSLDQLKLNLNQIETTTKNLKRQIKIQKDLLKFQIGLNNSDSITITEDLEVIFNSSNIQQLFSAKLDETNNIDYQILNTQEALQELSIKREKSKFLPSLSAFYQHQQSGQGNEFDFYQDGDNWFPANIVGASISMPILTSGSSISKVQQAQLELDKIENNKEDVRQSLIFSLENAKSELINNYNTYLQETENMELAKDIYDKGLIKFKEGTVSSIELTQLNIQYLQSQTSYYSSILNLLNNKVTIDKLIKEL